MDVLVELPGSGRQTFRIEQGTTAGELLSQAVAAFAHTSPCELVLGGEVLEPSRILQRVLGCLISGPGYEWRVVGFRIERPGTGGKYVDGLLVPASTPDPDWDAYPQ